MGGGSSNGRTTGSGSVYQGSNPCPPANTFLYIINKSRASLNLIIYLFIFPSVSFSVGSNLIDSIVKVIRGKVGISQGCIDIPVSEDLFYGQ